MGLNSPPVLAGELLVPEAHEGGDRARKAPPVTALRSPVWTRSRTEREGGRMMEGPSHAVCDGT